MYSSPETRLLLNTRLLPVLVGLLLIMQLVAPYRGWLILLVGLGGSWLVSYFWARSLRRGLNLTRQVRFGWTQVGDRLEERFILSNVGWAPALWVEVIDHSTMPDYRGGRATGVGSHTENRWQPQHICARRGLFTLGPTTLQTGDPFGLYTVTLHYPDSTALTVTPPVVPLPAIEVAPGGRAGAGRPRPNAFEHTVSAAGVRSYVPGDTLHAIHWPTSARRGSLFVRLFDNTPAGDWWIFLDVERRVQAGQGQTATEEHGVILAASLADRGQRLGRATGLAAQGETLVWLPPQVGDSQRRAILQALARVEPGSLALGELLARTRPALEQMASLILITPAVDGNWIEALMLLLRRGSTATVLLLDPLAFGGSADAGGVAALLTELGVAHYLITPDLLDRPEARPGQQGAWKWRITPRGRAVPIRRPDEAAWKALS